MDAMQLSANSTNSTNSTNSIDQIDSQVVDFILSMVGFVVCCFFFAMFSIHDYIASLACLEHQRLLSEKGTTEQAAITKKEKVNINAEDKTKEEKMVWELDYTVKVAGPNGEQMTMKVTKQQVLLDDPAAAGLDKAETVEVWLLPSRPYAVDLKVFAKGEATVSVGVLIFLQVIFQIPGLLVLCYLLSVYYEQWNPPMFAPMAALWILLMFLFAGVVYLRRDKLGMRLRVAPKNGRTGTVTLMNTGAKEAFLA